MRKEISIVWFRQDLRITDNHALQAASKIGFVLPIYIFDDCAPVDFRLGSASKIWLHESLNKLDKLLNASLNIYTGQADHVIKLLIKRYNITHVFWNICYEPWHIHQENMVKQVCNQASVHVGVFNSNYLYCPEQVLKKDRGYYKVFTAYKNRVRSLRTRAVIFSPKHITFIKDTANTITLPDLNLLPDNTWFKNRENIWETGEIAARKKLTFFIKNHLSGYKKDRDYPSKESVSRLSPYLHFGEISPSQVLKAIDKIGHKYAQKYDIEHFISEILWREFSCYLLYHFPELPRKNVKNKFNNIIWDNNSHFFQAWKDGNTGYPFIDAGMRELSKTGYMHNRARMVVASFLIKNLNIDWRWGMDWFWERLVDADLANNSANWQWVAGSGVDAAPYFRIFNPTLQGEKFDKNGDYTKNFVPELKGMPKKYLFKPWTAPAEILKSAGVILGETYPMPIVDFAISRKKALARYRHLSPAV